MYHLRPTFKESVFIANGEEEQGTPALISSGSTCILSRAGKKKKVDGEKFWGSE
jgi:hypothetical protein